MSRFAQAMQSLRPGADARHSIEGAEREEGQLGVLPTQFSEADLKNGLLRGVRDYDVVAGFGKHWEAGSLHSEKDRSWAFSQPVARNTAFVSHSWDASRFLKWLSLLAFLNGRLTAAAVVSTAAIATYVQYAYTGDFLPFAGEQMMYGHDVHTQKSRATWIVAVAVGMLVFFGGHHLRRPLIAAGLLEPNFMFLDKLVIHQSDPELMEAGIKKLGAFVRTSDTFLVLWSGQYLTRLWCSYEIAVFAYLKNAHGFSGKLVVWPLPFTMIALAKVLQSILQCCIITAAPALILERHGLATVIAMTAMVLPYALSTKGMVDLCRDIEILETQLSSYSLCNTRCFDQKDRERVETSVADWFGSVGGNRDEAIRSFDTFAQQQFQESIGGAFTQSGRIHWAAALWVCIPNMLLLAIPDMRNTQLPPYIYWQSTCNGFVLNLGVMMLNMAWQYDVVSRMERCRLGRYDPVAQRDDEAQSFPRRCGRCGLFLLEAVVCLLIEIALVAGFVYFAQQWNGYSMLTNFATILLVVYVYS